MIVKITEGELFIVPENQSQVPVTAELQGVLVDALGILLTAVFYWDSTTEHRIVEAKAPGILERQPITSL